MTTSTAPHSLSQIAFGDLEQELASTRRILERVPEEHFSWKPHEKSFALGSLAQHVANLVGWLSTILTTEELDLAGVGKSAPPTTRDEVLRTFDENVSAVRQALAQAEDATLTGSWTLRHGDHVIFTLPRLAVLRTVGISHIVHHRAQLTVYLRMLDVPVPGLYGPSADD